MPPANQRGSFCLILHNEGMRSRFLLLMLIPALLVAADRTKLAIAVKNPDGHPVDRASVIVKFVKGRSVVKLGKKMRTAYELRTNQDGMAKIPDIPQGKILVQVIAKNYQTFGQYFDIDEDEKTIEVKLNSPQAQYSSHD